LAVDVYFTQEEFSNLSGRPQAIHYPIAGGRVKTKLNEAPRLQITP
jgi:hypothetical protein